MALCVGQWQKIEKGMRAQGQKEEGLRIPSNPSWANQRTWQGQLAWCGVGSSWEEKDRRQPVLKV